MYSFLKRFFDLIMSISGLIVLLPLFVVVIVTLRLTGEGEIFYKQQRIGLRNSRFGLYKFATMAKDSPNMGTGSITLRNDSRVTKFGKFLRYAKINELPQIINVIKGDMSLVGPRPFMDETFETYPQHVQEKVYDVMPGLTGIGSIVFRDEEGLISDTDEDPREFYRREISPRKGELELWYQANASLWLDFKLLLATGLVLFISPTRILRRFFPGCPAELLTIAPSESSTSQ